MGYMRRYGRRPMEYASKTSHGYIINDPYVKEFLSFCELPKRAFQVSLEDHLVLPVKKTEKNPISHIIAIDGGYNHVYVQKEFPSSTICFFQFGSLIFSIEDLNNIGHQPFIDPKDISKLKQIQRLKLTLPIKNIPYKEEKSLRNSVRRALYDFFMTKPDGEPLIETLEWFVFEKYINGLTGWSLSSCPTCGERRVLLDHKKMSNNYTFKCSLCNEILYLTDVFRLHEVIDEELGAGGILGYISTTIEQLLIVHLIRLILEIKPSLLDELLFIKDGPLAFFGQTANMHKPMRILVKYLFQNHNLYLAGLEKSGSFVEHADEIADKLEKGTVLILDNDYIYKNIIPGKADPNKPYGSTTYYSNKMIYKTCTGQIYVVSIPTENILLFPKESELKNLHVILTNIEKLKCDMYDNSLIPVALVNKLISLSNHPSSRILQKFALESLKNGN